MIANAVTFLRLLLVAPFAYTILQDGGAPFSALLILFAIATDLADGPIARGLGTASDFGRMLDHGTDFLFVVSGLAALALRGTITFMLPLMIVLAFAQYVIGSGKVLRMNRLGRTNGILYFFPLCGDILARLGLTFLAPLIAPLAWVLVVATLVSIGDRLRPHRQKAPDLHGEGR